MDQPDPFDPHCRTCGEETVEVTQERVVRGGIESDFTTPRRRCTNPDCPINNPGPRRGYMTA